VLAAALEREEADLVLFGQQAADSESYVMAAAVADRLQRPLVTQVAQLTLDGQTIRAKRQTEEGYDVIEAPLPAVVSVADSINDPRYPSLKAIMGAKKKPQQRLSAADLGIGESPRTEVLALSAPPAKAGGVRIADEGGSSVDEIVAFLVERKLI
jgi:electron transfer flavoprotein beta subunit